ncbi:MAG: hypothetical protein Ct9H300mP27_05980 [Chloroflexota bacterium]|nr:MAG: hypothetical protein Ct9H300mP27_05980 [Chloroflexota bacterium]
MKRLYGLRRAVLVMSGSGTIFIQPIYRGRHTRLLFLPHDLDLGKNRGYFGVLPLRGCLKPEKFCLLLTY